MAPATLLTDRSMSMPQGPFVSYAQNGEDILLWRALKNVQHGFYIDVGAQDPINFSVTKAFYERGWHGINIEPVQQWYDCLVQDRPHDINLRVAASNQLGTIRLFDVEGSGLSTSNPELAHRHEAAGFRLHEQVVECTTLDRICADNAVGTVHFLKIDCEGSEKPALEGISLSDVRPWIILIEATEPLSTTPSWQPWEHLLTGRGYQFVFFDGLNRFYLANEQTHLATAFNAPANVFDGALKVSEVAAERRIDQLQIEIEGLRGAAAKAWLQAELAAKVAEREHLQRELDAVRAGYEQLARDVGAINAERDQLQHRFAAACAEREQLQSRITSLSAEREQLQARTASLSAERDDLRARQAALLSSHSWAVTAPLRGARRASAMVRHGMRRVARAALRPLFHAMRPAMRRLSQNGFFHASAVAMLGRNSRITQHARLFLFGQPLAAPPGGVDVCPAVATDPQHKPTVHSWREAAVMDALRDARTRNGRGK